MFRIFQNLFRKKIPAEHMQDRMIALLYSGIDAVHIKDILMHDKKLLKYKEYIQEMDIEMLAVGSELTRKWGNRVSENNTPEV